ncbi:ribosome recycling factor [Candidatus Terasakiella magnetica]|uniref:Ribosome-recycling factor n=2 Tax=Candidatus Terasakiella magnetica TaxID=1867952 RepID=A0A1C3RCM3_9PROT|nr:ribosome recycling factor [Candidatus Terasakiella magnetica]
MSDFNSLKKELHSKMDKAVDVLHNEFAGLRTGRASTSLLDPIMVDVYGSKMPINQVGTVSVPEARMLSVQVWDKSNVKMVEKAIREAGLGLNPQADGTLVRIPIPPLNEERRKELVKVAGKYAEDTRIAIRNVRRHGNDELKKMEKDGAISEDEHRDYAKEIQSETDAAIKKVDETLAHKEEEIMQV